MSNQPPHSGSSLLDEAQKLLTQTLVSWGLPGAFSFLTVHFARQRDWQSASLCLAITAVLAIFLRFWSRINPRLDNLFEQTITTVEDIFSGDKFKRAYYKNIFYDYRNFRTQGFRVKSNAAFSLEKLFIPLRIAPKEYNQRISFIAQSVAKDTASKPSIQRNGQYIWDLISAYKKQPEIGRIVILGSPGSGKTTLLEHVALTYAQRKHLAQQNVQPPRLIPILLYLREYWEDILTGNSPDLADLLQSCEQYRRLRPPPHWFKNKLEQGKCLVMLDGLDEVPEDQNRSAISDWVDQQIRNYPTNFFIVTSRPLGYEISPLRESVTLYQTLSFNLEETSQFIRHWYHQHEISRNLWKEDPGTQILASRNANALTKRIQNHPALVSMAVNPLLLTMILNVHCYRGALPGSRVELYQEICDVLLGRRQEEKNVPDRLTSEQKKDVLQHLALDMMIGRQSVTKISEAESLIQERLSEIDDGFSPRDFINNVKDSGLLIEVEKGYIQFAHKSFQEYLAAVQVRENTQEDILLDQITDSWWHESIRLYAAQKDVSNIIEKALSYQGSQQFVYALSLAYDCLEEKRSIKLNVKERLERTLKEGLEADEPEIFQLTAKVKLLRRLKGLLRLDENIGIDRELITHAEYQLFIDDAKARGEHRAPFHWENDHFHKGQANKPVSGVAIEDAEAFCTWLTQFAADPGNLVLNNLLSQNGMLPFLIYKLPPQNYVEKYPLTLENSLGHGYWHTTEDLLTTKKKQRVNLFINSEDTLFCQRVTQHLIGIAKERLNLSNTQLHEWLSAENVRKYVAIDIHAALAQVEHLIEVKVFADHLSEVKYLAKYSPRVIDAIMDSSDTVSYQLASNELLDTDGRPRNVMEVADREISLESRKRVVLLIQEKLESVLDFWDFQETIYKEVLQDRGVQSAAKVTVETCNLKIRGFKQRSRKVLETYIFFLALEARFNQEIPPYESIRVMYYTS